MATVTNERTGRTIAENLAEADTFATRVRGLMFRSELGPGEGLRIEPCGSIHMMFMRFAIDAVFYDRDGRVTKVGRNVRPWIGVAFGGRGARGVIELANGAADDVEPGDTLAFAA